MTARCPRCGTTQLGRAWARLAWWLHLSPREDLTHTGCQR